MAEKRGYSVTDVLNGIIDFYQYGESKDSLRKKIQEVCEQIPSKDEKGKISNLWKTSNDGKKGSNHYFTETEKREIMKCPVLLNFFRDQYKKMVKEYGEIEGSDGDRAGVDESAYNFMCRFREIQLFGEQAEEANQANREYFTSRGYGDDPGMIFHPSEEELKQKKLEIMVEALFLRYYTPVDEEKLENDMTLARMGGGDDNTPETLKAYRSLKNGANYYNERNDTPSP